MSNATDDGSTDVVVFNNDDYDAQEGTFSSSAWIAKYPGEFGNSIAVATCTSAAEFENTLPGTFAVERGSKVVTYTANSDEDLTTYFNVGDKLNIDGTKYEAAVIAADEITLSRHYAGKTDPTNITRVWRFANLFGSAPAQDRMHVVIVDDKGTFTKDPGFVLERYDSISTVLGTKFADGTSAYYKTAINRRSAYVYVGDVSPGSLNIDDKVAYTILSGGISGDKNFGIDEQIDGFDLFANAEAVDVSLLISGAASSTLASYLIENIAETRMDAMVFISPLRANVVNNVGQETTSIVEFRNSLPSSSYAVLDSGWKYMYDKYNDVYRWIPLNGDIAGLCAQTDRTRDPWFSPAGFNRGKIKNCTKLAFSPRKEERDDLYTNGINPVTDFPGQGTVLFGDKTLLASESAFSRINVRRLFIIVEKSIANASKSTLFELNDEFTRSQFISLIEPFLREIKGRRGIEDFKVIADQTVNTAQVRNNNQFVGQIFIKPVNSINFIRLDFIAVKSGVSFDEVVDVA